MVNKIIYCSKWQKGTLVCYVRSETEYISNGYEEIPKKVKTFTFSGYNPFPCYSMKSTFESVSAWLHENGWERKPGGYMVVRSDNIDMETGEVVGHDVRRIEYVPV